VEELEINGKTDFLFFHIRALTTFVYCIPTSALITDMFVIFR
jgi:hypothetical protein